MVRLEPVPYGFYCADILYQPVLFVPREMLKSNPVSVRFWYWDLIVFVFRTLDLLESLNLVVFGTCPEFDICDLDSGYELTSGFRSGCTVIMLLRCFIPMQFTVQKGS